MLAVEPAVGIEYRRPMTALGEEAVSRVWARRGSVFAVVSLLSSLGCGGYCFDETHVEFVLDETHPAVLISITADTPEILTLRYRGIGMRDELLWETDAPCRVAIYNYGTGEVGELWPMPGDPPAPGVRIDHDANLPDSEARMLPLARTIVEDEPGPVTGTIVVTSCGTATVRGKLEIEGQCKDIYEPHAVVSLEVETLTEPP